MHCRYNRGKTFNAKKIKMIGVMEPSHPAVVERLNVCGVGLNFARFSSPLPHQFTHMN
jgi:hypothetical protein